jgi:hypothetical protein
VWFVVIENAAERDPLVTAFLVLPALPVLGGAPPSSAPVDPEAKVPRRSNGTCFRRRHSISWQQPPAVAQ